MLSHEPKNYALLAHDGTLVLRGVAFRSSRAEPYGEIFLRRAINRLLTNDVAGVHDVYVAVVAALRRREVPTRDVSSRVRLTKSPARYLESRERRREVQYEALLANGVTEWSVGDRLRIYRKRAGEAGLVDFDEAEGEADPRDYDVEYYVRQLRETFAARLARALRPADFDALFSDPDQLSLLPPRFDTMRPILTQLVTY
jgi:DNA polymerase elongation subunit (family B)